MAGEPVITVVGNLTDDPELRFTPSGAAVANFTVAQTPRRKEGDEWVDGEASFFRCAVWRQYAENVAESLQKGMQVVVTGRLRTRYWEDRDGNKRNSMEVDVDDIGPCLRFATAKVQRTRSNRAPANDGGNWGGGQPSGGQQGGQGGGGQQSGGWGNDPWASPAGQSDEPPF